MTDKFMKSITFVEGGDIYYPLPKVTNADDGKVLKVIDGEWSVTDLIPPHSYLSFIGNEDFTLKTYNTPVNCDGTLEYSNDTKTWNAWNGTEISSVGSKMYLRGTGNTKITGEYLRFRFVFTGTDALKIACEGNIENLLDYKTVSAGGHPTMGTSCYQSMFYNCTALTTAPELPATTLASDCYQSMFSGCTSLISVPALPATTLADSCYSGMFSNCTSLTSAPELPATTLANNCYDSMFYGCKALTTVPALPATTLANSCYSGMFQGCKALTTVPALPATTLAEGCYRNMFYGCISLTTAPSLPATTLADNCYRSMFADCTSLTTVPALPATTLAASCCRSMFQYCKSIKLSTTKTGEYQTPYRIPTTGTGTTATDALTDMFYRTGGSVTETPKINTTYYTSNTVV